MTLYRDVLRVPEYFLFDPRHEYLDPSLQGYRLRRKRYVPIKMLDGRLPSEVIGLHLERDGRALRLYDPSTRNWLLTPRERAAVAEAELERLRRELEQLRRPPEGRP
jgi:Uma2 family endonuclease